MSKVSIFKSLDGFIASRNDEIEPLHDWLLAGSAARASDRCSVSGVGAVTVFFPGDSSLRMLGTFGKSTD
jgi:hypothetical protein